MLCFDYEAAQTAEILADFHFYLFEYNAQTGLLDLVESQWGWWFDGPRVSLAHAQVKWFQFW